MKFPLQYKLDITLIEFEWLCLTRLDIIDKEATKNLSNIIEFSNVLELFMIKH